jgi:Mn2+/Fe2+ NRAMP family transporter
MADNDSHVTGQMGDIVAGGFALATLILAEKVTALHILFGLPLFIYLIRDFRKPSSLSDRLVVSMAMAFVGLLFTCYPVQYILSNLDDPPDWDVVLAIQWIVVFPLVWAVRELFQSVDSRGEA